jgi:hypothetical protein
VSSLDTCPNCCVVVPLIRVLSVECRLDLINSSDWPIVQARVLPRDMSFRVVGTPKWHLVTSLSERT